MLIGSGWIVSVSLLFVVCFVLFCFVLFCLLWLFCFVLFALVVLFLFGIGHESLFSLILFVLLRHKHFIAKLLHLCCSSSCLSLHLTPTSSWLWL